MKAQKPAEGISVDKNFGDAKVFNIECDCSSDDHSVKMWIEVQRDKDIPDIEVSFYVTTWTPAWADWGKRLKAVYEILFKGVHKQEHHLLLGKQSALNFAEAIKTEVVNLEKNHLN